jgi:hypothetical protein
VSEIERKRKRKIIVSYMHPGKPKNDICGEGKLGNQEGYVMYCSVNKLDIGFQKLSDISTGCQCSIKQAVAEWYREILWRTLELFYKI